MKTSNYHPLEGDIATLEGRPNQGSCPPHAPSGTRRRSEPRPGSVGPVKAAVVMLAAALVVAFPVPAAQPSKADGEPYPLPRVTILGSRDSVEEAIAMIQAMQDAQDIAQMMSIYMLMQIASDPQERASTCRTAGELRTLAGTTASSPPEEKLDAAQAVVDILAATGRLADYTIPITVSWADKPDERMDGILIEWAGGGQISSFILSGTTVVAPFVVPGGGIPVPAPSVINESLQTGTMCA